MHLQDLVQICRRFNQASVKYVLIGGFAIIIHGFERTTRDIDFMVDASDENIQKIIEALRDIMPEACAEMKLSDVRDYVVLRMVNDNWVIDLLKEVGPTNYEKVIQDSFIEQIDGVPIRVAGLDSMIELKKGIRERDGRDYLFLTGKKEYLNQQKD